MPTRVPTGWLLIRGLGREARHWFDFPDQLAAVTGVPCLTLDLPGTGTEAQRSSPSSVREIAEDVLARFLDQQLEPRWGLIGLSLGGMIALEMVQLAPLAFSHIVLVNSSSTLSPPARRMKPGAVLKLTIALSQASTLKREEHIYALVGQSRFARERAIPAAAFFETAPIRLRTVLQQLQAAARFAPPARLGQRCLVVSTLKDRIVSPSCSAQLSRHFCAERVEHPRAGRDPPSDDPVWLARRVSAWTQDH